jgi:hypothetical protein
MIKMTRLKKNEKSVSTKKTTITLAIDENILNEIRQDADHHGLSINSKINNVLTKYVLFDKYAEYEHPVVIPSKNFRFILDNIEEDKLIKEFEVFIFDTITTDLTQRNISITLDNWIKYVFAGVCLYGGTFSDFSTHVDEKGHLCLIFRHNYGIKWSRIMSNVFAKHLENILGYHTIATILPSSIVLKILEIC